MFFCNFLAAGPSVAVEQTTVDFLGPKGPDFSAHVAKVAYFYSTTSLCQGMGMLFWMPLIVKYGRRPIYVISFLLYVGTGLWCGFAGTYAVELAGRIVMGLASGAGECLGPLVIADLFFLHERGAVMAFYTAALSMGVAGGIIVDGLITISHGWRYIYYVASALLGLIALLVVFTFPETTFDRLAAPEAIVPDSNIRSSPSPSCKSHGSTQHHSYMIPEKRSYLDTLRLFGPAYTSESLLQIFVRPLVLILLPPVLWTSLVFAVTIGFLVAITSNYATAFSEAYGFLPWQSGLCFFSSIVGSLVGIAFGGHVSDLTADWFTRRNGGIREPEMRLPAIVIGGVCLPVSLILYGIGLDRHLHWIVPTIGLGLLSFAIGQCTNVAMVYVIDSYRPAVGEVTVSILAFKGNCDPVHYAVSLNRSGNRGLTVAMEWFQLLLGSCYRSIQIHGSALRVTPELLGRWRAYPELFSCLLLSSTSGENPFAIKLGNGGSWKNTPIGKHEVVVSCANGETFVLNTSSFKHEMTIAPCIEYDLDL